MTPTQQEAAEELSALFREIHGALAFTLDVVEAVADLPGADVYGSCNFLKTPPEILLRMDLDESGFVEYLCHELAHRVCGLAAGHNKSWEDVKDELSNRFWANRLSRSVARMSSRGHR